MQKKAVEAFLKRWGWPIMGALAAAPVLAHGLDWKSRALAKQKLKAEQERKAREQLAKAQGLVPSADDVYKTAAYARHLKQAEQQSPIEKLDVLDKALKTIRGK